MMIIDQRAIDARNRLNRKADDVEPMLQALFASYLGKKVWRISGYGGLTAAVAKEVERLANAHGLTHESGYRLIISSEVAWIRARLQLRYNVESGGVNYIDCGFHAGKRDDQGVLIERAELCYPAYRPQFTLDQVQATKKRAYELEQQARDLRSSVSCFR